MGDRVVLEMNLDAVPVNYGALQFGARVRSQDHGKLVPAQRISLLAYLSKLGTAHERNAWGTIAGWVLWDVLVRTHRLGRRAHHRPCMAF